MSTAVHRRMLKEYLAIQKNSASRPHLELLEPIQEDDLLHWQAILLGTADSGYEGGRFKLDIVIPTSYPIQPPTIRFLTTICHPNVHFKVKLPLAAKRGMNRNEQLGTTRTCCLRHSYGCRVQRPTTWKEQLFKERETKNSFPNLEQKSPVQTGLLIWSRLKMGYLCFHAVVTNRYTFDLLLSFLPFSLLT
jgi:hypothetical protein